MSADLTVIVVAYNHQQYVRECVESIFQQDLLPRKILLADDASSDGSPNIIQELSANHRGLMVPRLAHENRGLTKTLNVLLAEVATEYVTYISADDKMLPGRISGQCALMDRSGCSLSYTDAVVIDETSTVQARLSSDEFVWPCEPQRSDNILECLFRSNWIPAASIMMRTLDLRALGGYNEALFYEDYELLVRAAAQDWAFSYDPRPLVAVRRLSTSLGATGFAGRDPRFLRALDEAYRHFCADRSAPTYYDAFERRWALAKRMNETNASLQERLVRLWDARKGASSYAAVGYHIMRALTRTRIARDGLPSDLPQ